MCLLLKVCLSSLIFHFKSWWFYIKKCFYMCMCTWSGCECGMFTSFHAFSTPKRTTTMKMKICSNCLEVCIYRSPPNSHFGRANFSTIFNISVCIYFIAFLLNTAWIGLNCRPSKLLESPLSETELPTFHILVCMLASCSNDGTKEFEHFGVSVRLYSCTMYFSVWLQTVFLRLLLVVWIAFAVVFIIVLFFIVWVLVFGFGKIYIMNKL